MIEIKLLSHGNSISSHEMNERRALVSAVLESRTFAKSTKLAQFLKFICNQALDGTASNINEQQIGIHVFGRSPSYNAADDSIVRSQARLLRQRLEEYFEHEAPSALLVITIPKGGYVPVFEPRRSQAVAVSAAGTQAVEGPAALPSTVPDAANSRPHKSEASMGLRLGVLAAILVAAILGVGVWRMNRPVNSGSDELWARIFQTGRPVMIVPSDDALVLFEEQTQTTVSLDEYLNGSYLNRASSAGSGSISMSSDWFAAHQYTSTADLNIAVRLSRMPAARDAVIEARNARALRIDDLKGHNVILIGGLASNPWVSVFLKRLDFQVSYDWKGHEGYVLNKHPNKGEAAVYRDTVIDGTRHIYGVMAFLPGIEDQGEALLLQGTGMAGTESASDFPFNPRMFGAFAERIGATPHRLPYFEVLLETTSVGGNAPEVHVVTYHLIQP